VWSVGLAVGGYFVMLILFGLYASIRAPVILDRSARRITILRDKRSNEIQYEMLRLPVRQNHWTGASVYRETKRLVVDALGKLDEREQNCLRWMLTMDRAGNTEVQRGGFHGVPGRSSTKRSNASDFSKKNSVWQRDED